jgi:hypothetical protein
MRLSLSEKPLASSPLGTSKLLKCQPERAYLIFDIRYLRPYLGVEDEAVLVDEAHEGGGVHRALRARRRERRAAVSRLKREGTEEDERTAGSRHVAMARQAKLGRRDDNQGYLRCMSAASRACAAVCALAAG